MATTAASGIGALGATEKAATPVSDVSTLSSWVGPYVTGMLGKTQALSETPYQVYQGPMTAGESGLQSKVFQGLGSLSFPGIYGQSFTGQAPAGALDASGKPMTGQGVVSQYMNPYLQAVLNPQLDELRRQSQITQMQNAAKATGAGAFGGSRQALMDTETQRNLLDQMNRTVGQGYATAYDKAMQQFNTEQAQAKSLVDTLAEQGAAQKEQLSSKVSRQTTTSSLHRETTRRRCFSSSNPCCRVCLSLHRLRSRGRCLTWVSFLPQPVVLLKH